MSMKVLTKIAERGGGGGVGGGGGGGDKLCFPFFFLLQLQNVNVDTISKCFVCFSV